MDRDISRSFCAGCSMGHSFVSTALVLSRVMNINSLIPFVLVVLRYIFCSCGIVFVEGLFLFLLHWFYLSRNI